MRRVFFLSLAAGLLVAGGLFAQTLGAVLTASQEVPPTTTPGFGNATVTFDSARQNITVTITVANLGSPINNFHIHEQAAGVAGPVVISLIGLGGVFNNNTMTGTFPIPSDVAQRMLQNPGGFYVNVHTTQFPGGAIRGQLAYVSGGPVTYAAELRPGNEVPPVSSNAFGSAFVTFDPINHTLTWEVNTNGIANATLSHVHKGAAGVAGGVVISLATSSTQIPNGRTHGTVTLVPAGSLTAGDITNLGSAATANGYYVNVHSTAFGGGEIRGQLVPANEYDVAVAGHVTNGLGQTFVTDVRVFNPSYSAPAAALLEYFPAGTSANTNASTSTVVNLAPRGTAILDDIAGASGLNVTGTGALRVSSASQVAVTSRIFADLRSSGKGTFGQFAPAQARISTLRRGVIPQLSNRSVDLTSGFRTNVGFFNPNTGPATVRLELRDGAGNLLGQNTIALAALSQQQSSIGSYFPGVDLSNAQNLTLSFDASAGIAGYASVVDNVSADQIFVPAQTDIGVATTNL